MKRTISLILALILCLSMLAVSVTAGDEGEGEEEAIEPGLYYSVDFAELYANAGYTEAQDLKANGEEMEQVDIMYFGDASFVHLTETGLQAGSLHRGGAGFIVPTPKSGDFIVEMDFSMHDFNNNKDLKEALRYVMEFGFSWKNGGWAENNYINTTWKKDKTMTTNHPTNQSTASAAKMWDHMIGAADFQNDTLHFTFQVKNSYLQSWTISCGDDTISFYLSNYDRLACRASSGVFALRTRPFDDYAPIESGATPYINVESVSVTVEKAGEVVDTLENTLPSTRPLPTEPAIEFEDTRSTKYIPGYVLHNMDFSKIEDFDDTGYFVTNGANPTGFEVEDGLLKVSTDSKMNILLTGNQIPKNIGNYTYTVTFRFATPSSRFIGLLHDATFDANSGSPIKTGGTLVRMTGIMDGASYISKYEQAHAAQLTDMMAGEWITATVSAMDGEVSTAIIECNGNTVKWIKTGGLDSLLDSYLGIRISDGTHVEISNIQVVAGYYEDYETLTWPAEEGALVQTVTSAALQTASSGDGDGDNGGDGDGDNGGTNGGNNGPNGGNNGPNGGNNGSNGGNTATEEKTSATTAPTATTAPAATTPKTNEAQSGCQSVTPAFAAIGVAMVLAFPLIRKNRKDD